MNTIERQRDHFERVASHYHQARQSPRHRLLKKLMWDDALPASVRAHIPTGRQVRLLEPMCGACEGRRIIDDQLGLDLDYQGFDYAPTMVRLARDSYPDADIWEQDVTAFEPKAADRDIVLLVGSLHHVAAHATDVVRRLADSLTPGGLFIVSEPTHNNWFFRKVRESIYSSNENFDEETERGFTTAEMDEMCSAAGLEIEHQTYPTMLAYVLWGNPEAFPALDRGPLWLVRAYVAIERLLWRTPIAKYCGFGTFAIYRKPAGSNLE